MQRFELPQMSPEQYICLLAKAGLTNEEIATMIGIGETQFSTLLSKDRELWQMLEDAKEEPNHQVERALFKRALGYQVKETTKEAGRPVKVVIKEIAPDPISCIFWLKNRDPKKWRDVIEMKFSLRDRMDRAHTAVSTTKRKALRSDFGD